MIILGLLCTIIAAVYAWIVWKRIPFAKACLQIAIAALKTYPSPFIVNSFMVIVSITFIIIDVLAYIGIRQMIGESNAFIEIIWLFFQIWHLLTCINVSHTTSCGVMGKWCFGTNKTGVTKQSFIYSITTKFGSIAFGSFIVAVIRTIEAILRQAREEARKSGNMGAVCLLCFIECIISFMGDILNYINSYAFIRVAMYHETFCVSAKATWNLFMSKGFTMLINDDISSLPINIGFFFGIIVFIIVPFAINSNSIISIFIVFIAGLFIYVGMAQIISSFIKTLFVCWVEDPNKLNQWRPDSYMKLTNAINGYKSDSNDKDQYNRAETVEQSEAVGYPAKK